MVLACRATVSSGLAAAFSYRGMISDSIRLRSAGSVAHSPSSAVAAFTSSRPLVGYSCNLRRARARAASKPFCRPVSHSRFKNSAISLRVGSAEKPSRVFGSVSSRRARAGSSAMSGRDRSFSHLLTAAAVTPRVSASCSWVSPRAPRRLRMVSLSFILRSSLSDGKDALHCGCPRPCLLPCLYHTTAPARRTMEPLLRKGRKNQPAVEKGPPCGRTQGGQK